MLRQRIPYAVKLRSKMRLVSRGILFMIFALIGLWGHFHYATPLVSSRSKHISQFRHLLQVNGTEKSCISPLQKTIDDQSIPSAFTAEQISGGAFILHFIGTMYMMVGLSIVCDEYFVPALEEIIEVQNISPDVAGATLMAAGGSAPELATSLVGTFQQSEIGFGTIVGSAVFNVLFVIGMCVYFSKGVLKLTWWPLFRDCSYYALSLAVLASFFSFSTPYFISIWESIILLFMYIGYVVLMKYNERIYVWVESKLKGNNSNKKEPIATSELSDESKKVLPQTHLGPDSAQETKRESAHNSRQSYKESNYADGKASRRMTLRTGIVHIFHGKDLLVAAGVQAVQQIRGNCKETFSYLDKDKDGFIDVKEFGSLLEEVSPGVSQKDVQDAIKALDKDDDGQINFKEFSEWYFQSEGYINKQVSERFDDLDYDNVGKIEVGKINQLLSDLPEVKDVDAAKKQLIQDGDEYLTKEKFLNWHKQAGLFKSRKLTVAEEIKEADDIESGITMEWPDNRRGQLGFLFTFPLVFPMYMTIPNVLNEKWKNWYIVSFVMSIVWIGIWSYFMVNWATLLGYGLGFIPPKVMGLVFLSAGTSIPDLLTSVAVAVRGQGDMAVSSSIGSNIFDVLIGLPLPWLLYSLVNNFADVAVGSAEDQVGISVGILFVMLIIIVTTIKCVNWQLNKPLAIVFFSFYVVYVAIELIRYYVFGPGKDPSTFRCA